MVTVSVVLCAYNGENFIREQLASILGQSHSRLEIIVQDDCSNDQTAAIVREMQEADARIKLFQNDSNLGFNRNFESAIRKATSDWIALSDQDDIWHPDKISTMLAEYDGKSVLMHCDSVLFKGQPDYSLRQLPSHRRFSGSDARQLFVQNTVEGHTVLFQRRLLKQAFPFPEDVFFDWWLGYCAAVSGGVQWVSRTLVWRRIHANNQSDGQEKKVDKLIATYNAFVGHPLANDAQKEFGQTLISLLSDGNTKQLRRFLWRNRTVIFFFKRKRFLNMLSQRRKIGRLIADFNFTSH